MLGLNERPLACVRLTDRDLDDARGPRRERQLAGPKGAVVDLLAAIGVTPERVRGAIDMLRQ